MYIEHVAVWCQDIERLRRFYERYFGAIASPKYRNDNTQFQSYFLSFSGQVRLELMQRPDVAQSRGADEEILGYAHLAISVGSEEAVDALTAELEADGYRRLSGPRRTGDGYYESVILDPEDNRIEITV